MASQVRIKLNSPGIVAFLKSPEVQADINRRSDAVHAALPTGNGEEWHLAQFVGHDRAQAIVGTGRGNAPSRRAAADNALQRALTAGR